MPRSASTEEGLQSVFVFPLFAGVSANPIGSSFIAQCPLPTSAGTLRVCYVSLSQTLKWAIDNGQQRIDNDG